MIPGWTIEGNLPPGIHEAPWVEVVARFGAIPVRLQLLVGLANALRHLATAGCQQIWLDGSLVTDVERIEARAPRDSDTCWDIAGVDLSRLALDAEEFFEFRAGHPAQKRRWRGEFFPVGGPIPPGGIDQVEFFQTDRAGRPKGIILLILNPMTIGELERFVESEGNDVGE